MLRLKTKYLKVLLHLIRRGTKSFDEVTQWALDQYTNEGIDPVIEKIGIAYNEEDVIEIILDELAHRPHVFVIDAKFLLGEARVLYEDPKLKEHYQQPIYNLAYRDGHDIDLPKAERSTLLDITNYTGNYDDWEPLNENWQDMDRRRNEDWIEFIELCQKYKPYYLDSVRIFEFDYQTSIMRL